MASALIACVYADVSELTTILGEDGYVYSAPDLFKSFNPTNQEVKDDQLK